MKWISKNEFLFFMKEIFPNNYDDKKASDSMIQFDKMETTR